jgi:hypothetical protein
MDVGYFEHLLQILGAHGLMFDSLHQLMLTYTSKTKCQDVTISRFFFLTRNITLKGEWFMCEEQVVSQPFVMNVILFKVLTKKISENNFTISELSCEFPHISYTVLYEIITAWLGYHKLCKRWVIFKKMFTVCTERRKWLRLLTVLEKYYKNDDEFLSCISENKFTISELSCEFPHISYTILYEIIAVWLGYNKLCKRWVLFKKIFTVCMERRKWLRLLTV